jgi:hypothetical protein
MPAATPERARAGDDLGRTLRSHAFGIDVRFDFVAPGLPAGAPPEELPATRLELVPRAEIDAEWRPAAPERLLEEEFENSRATRTIDRDAAVGYRLYARYFGLALISPGGERARCAPPGVAAWRWQRFLVGRVLPWVALLRGREVFHASAVRVGDRAIAFVGATGGGKTSLALRMVMRGAGFVTDDVLALDPRPDGRVLAWPGASILAVRPAEKAALARGQLARVGQVLGTSGKTYVALDREAGPLPLGALYFLTPAPRGGTRIEAGGVDARALLGSSFVSSVATPERLARLLDVSARVSAGVPMFRAQVDPAEGAEALAAAIHEHSQALAAEAAA